MAEPSAESKTGSGSGGFELKALPSMESGSEFSRSSPFRFQEDDFIAYGFLSVRSSSGILRLSRWERKFFMLERSLKTLYVFPDEVSKADFSFAVQNNKYEMLIKVEWIASVELVGEHTRKLFGFELKYHTPGPESTDDKEGSKETKSPSLAASTSGTSVASGSSSSKVKISKSNDGLTSLRANASSFSEAKSWVINLTHSALVDRVELFRLRCELANKHIAGGGSSALHVRTPSGMSLSLSLAKSLSKGTDEKHSSDPSAVVLSAIAPGKITSPEKPTRRSRSSSRSKKSRIKSGLKFAGRKTFAEPSSHSLSVPSPSADDEPSRSESRDSKTATSFAPPSPKSTSGTAAFPDPEPSSPTHLPKVIISPFKESLWQFMQLLADKSDLKGKRELRSSLKDRTMKVFGPAFRKASKSFQEFRSKSSVPTKSSLVGARITMSKEAIPEEKDGPLTPEVTPLTVIVDDNFMKEIEANIVDTTSSRKSTFSTFSVEDIVKTCQQMAMELLPPDAFSSPKYKEKRKKTEVGDTLSGEDIVDWLCLSLKFSKPRALIFASKGIEVGALKAVEGFTPTVTTEERVSELRLIVGGFDVKKRYILLANDALLMRVKLKESVNFVNYKFWVDEMLYGSKPLEIKKVRKNLKSYPDAFHGSDFMQWLLDSNVCEHMDQARAFGDLLISEKVITCVSAEIKVGISALAWGAFHESEVFSFSKGFARPRRSRSVDLSAQQVDFLDLDEVHWDQFLKEIVVTEEFFDYFVQFSNDEAIWKALLAEFAEEYSTPSTLSSLIRAAKTKLTEPESDKRFSVELLKKAFFRFLTAGSTNLKDKLPKVIDSEEFASAHYVIDLYWELQKYQTFRSHYCLHPWNCTICASTCNDFVQFVESVFVGDKYVGDAVISSLFNTMINEFWTSSPLHYSDQLVIRPLIWRPIFKLLKGAPEESMLRHIKTAFTLILQNDRNTENFAKLEDWQEFLVSFSASVSAEVNRYVIGILSYVLYRSFLKIETSVEVLFFSLFNRITEEYKHRGRSSLDVTYLLLQSMLKVAVNDLGDSQKKLLEFYSIDVAIELCTTMLKFIFQSPAMDLLTVDAAEPSATKEEEKERRKEKFDAEEEWKWGVHFFHLKHAQTIFEHLQKVLRGLISRSAEEKSSSIRTKEFKRLNETESLLNSGKMLLEYIQRFVVQFDLQSNEIHLNEARLLLGPAIKEWFNTASGQRAHMVKTVLPAMLSKGSFVTTKPELSVSGRKPSMVRHVSS